MAWDAVMLGSLEVPQANLEEWLSSPVSTDEFPWLEELAGTDVHLDTPEALLAYLSDVQVAPHELFEVRVHEGTLTVNCFVSEDTWRDTCQALSMLVASAAPFGGQGDITFLGYRTINFGERVTVDSGGATFRRLTRAEQDAMQKAKPFKALDARIHARFDELVGRDSASGQRRRWVVHPFTGRRVLVPVEAT
jgi:hypothetical protein